MAVSFQVWRAVDVSRRRVRVLKAQVSWKFNNIYFAPLSYHSIMHPLNSFGKKIFFVFTFGLMHCPLNLLWLPVLFLNLGYSTIDYADTESMSCHIVSSLRTFPAHSADRAFFFATFVELGVLMTCFSRLHWWTKFRLYVFVWMNETKCEERGMHRPTKNKIKFKCIVHTSPMGFVVAIPFVVTVRCRHFHLFSFVNTKLNWRQYRLITVQAKDACTLFVTNKTQARCIRNIVVFPIA